jgi:hypothetical protein
MFYPAGASGVFSLRLDERAATQHFGELLKHSVLERIHYGFMNIAFAADGGRVAKLCGRRANGVCLLYVASSAQASASSTETEASRVRKSLSEISTPAGSRAESD